jgi:hypothetical protein
MLMQLYRQHVQAGLQQVGQHDVLGVFFFSGRLRQGSRGGLKIDRPAGQVSADKPRCRSDKRRRCPSHSNASVNA